MGFQEKKFEQFINETYPKMLNSLKRYCDAYEKEHQKTKVKPTWVLTLAMEVATTICATLLIDQPEKELGIKQLTERFALELNFKTSPEAVRGEAVH